MPRPAGDRPAELRGRVKGLRLEGKPVEAAEAEYARIVQDVEALAFRVDTLADATAGVKHAAERALAGLFDCTRAAIHAEAAEAAWRIAGETAAAAAGRLAELQGLHIVAGHFSADRRCTGPGGAGRSTRRRSPTNSRSCRDECPEATDRHAARSAAGPATAGDQCSRAQAIFPLGPVGWCRSAS